MRQLSILALSAIALSTIFAPAGHAQVANGNFATGDFTDWTTSPAGDPYYTVVNTAPSPDSTYAAEIGAYYDDSTPPDLIHGDIQQTLTTVVGQQYTISFLYGELNSNPSYGQDDTACCYLDPSHLTTSNDPSTNPWAQNNNLDVLWDGSSVYSDSNFFTSAQPSSTTDPDGGKTIGDYFYQPGSVTVTATSTSTLLEFDADDYQQNVIVTDVGVAPVPEPGTFALLASALAGLGLLARRRRGAHAA